MLWPILLCICIPFVFTQTINWKICSTIASNTACQQIARDAQLACQYNLHDVDCLLKINQNETNVGRITGEEALLGAKFLHSNVVVLAEITSRRPPSETVVIVKTEIPSGFENLRNKRLCHPGFKHDNLFSNRLLQEFESSIIQLNSSLCNNKLTLLERQISTLKYFFGESCRPGLWTQDKEFDTYLKREYSSLCNLCGDLKCDVDYKMPFNDSLKCLINNNADVAVTTLSEAQLFFNSSQNQQNYKYLCKQGNSSSYSAPCVWSKHLPDILVGTRNTSNDIKTYLKTFLTTKISEGGVVTNENREQDLTNILDLGRSEVIVFLPSEKSLLEYVQENTTIPSVESNKLCDTTLKWCTFSDADQQKCNWLSQAALNWGIQPVVQCVRSEGNDELSCLDDIKKKSADIVVASSDYAYASLKKGLVSIAYPETDTRFLSVILAVKNANDTSINKFQDLKGKRSCLPRFGGKEHLALVDTVRALKVTDGTNCDYGKLFSDFVGNSCTPGARSNLIKESTDQVDKDKLCDLCKSINTTSTAAYCNDDVINAYYGNQGSLKCLTDSIADFAVVTRQDLDNITESNFIVLCKNGTLATYPGLQVDNDCALNVIASSLVVAENGNEKIPDIISALYQFEKWFGQNLQKPFHLFDRFNNTKDLLFKDSTPGLSFSGDMNYIGNYKNLLRNVKECTSSSNMLTGSTFAFAIIFFILYFY